jgi:hypothetical protein
MSTSFKLGDNGAEGKLKVNGFGSCKLVPYGVLADFDSKFDDRWTTTKENEDWEDFIDWNSQVDQLKDAVYSFIPNDYFTKTQINSANYVREGDLIGNYSSVTQWAGSFATNEKAAAAYTLAVDANYTDLDGNTISAVSGIQLGAIAGYDNTSSYMDFMADNIRFFATSARIVDEETGELTPATIEVDDVDKVAKSPTYENGEPMPAFGMLAEPDGQGGYQYKTYFNGNVVFLDGANAGSTLIKGGYINTNLIETDKLIVGSSNTARHFGSWGTGDNELDEDSVMQDSGGQLTAYEVGQRNPIYEGIIFRDGDTYFNIGEGTNYVYDTDSVNDGVNAGWRSTRGSDSSGYSINLSEDLYVAHRDGSGNWDTSDASTKGTTIEVYSGTDKVTSEFGISIPVTAGFSLVGNVLTYTGTLTGDKPSKSVVITATNILNDSITLSKQYRIITLEDGNAYRLNIHQPTVKLAPNGEISASNTTITWDVTHHIGNSVVDATADKTVYYKGPEDSEYMSAGTDGTVGIADLVDDTHNKGEVEFIITEDDTASGMVYDKETLPIVWDAGSPYTAELTNDNHTCPSDATGVTVNYAGADTECKLYLGGGIIPLDDVSVEVDGVNDGTAMIAGATVEVTGTKVTLTGLSVDSAAIPIDFFYNGVPVNVTKNFSVSKGKQGTTGMGYKLALNPSVLKAGENANISTVVQFIEPDGSITNRYINDSYFTDKDFSIEGQYWNGSSWYSIATQNLPANNTYFSISVPYDAIQYSFKLNANGTLLDTEGSRVIKDGQSIKGDSGATIVTGSDSFPGTSVATFNTANLTTLFTQWSDRGSEYDFVTGDSILLTNTAPGSQWTNMWRWGSNDTWVDSTKLYIDGDAVVTGTIATSRLALFSTDGTISNGGSGTITYNSSANNGNGALVMSDIVADSIKADSVISNIVEASNPSARACIIATENAAYGFADDTNKGVVEITARSNEVIGLLVKQGTVKLENQLSVTGKIFAYDTLVMYRGINMINIDDIGKGYIAGHEINLYSSSTSIDNNTISIEGATGNIYAEGSINANASISPFTGSHPVDTSGLITAGDILYDTGSNVRHIDINNAICDATVTTVAKSKAVIGVYSHNSDISGEEHSYVNSLGEGLMNVCSQNGDIEVGDYICSSDVKGKGMKQDDDLLHNYTVAKARENIVWNELEVDNDKVFELDGYKWTQIACTYHCG